MKITKKQLRKIIKEESANLHEETGFGSVTMNYSALADTHIHNLIVDISTEYHAEEMRLYKSEPTAFGGQTFNQWAQQVSAAAEELEFELEDLTHQPLQKIARLAVNLTNEISAKLHNGEYA